jgi:hypothetical protein
MATRNGSQVKDGVEDITNFSGFCCAMAACEAKVPTPMTARANRRVSFLIILFLVKASRKCTISDCRRRR